jgi:hypothetical protein
MQKIKMLSTRKNNMTWRDRNIEYRRKHNMMQTNIKRE